MIDIEEAAMNCKSKAEIGQHLYNLLDMMSNDIIHDLTGCDERHFILYNGELNSIKYLAEMFFKNTSLYKKLEILYLVLDAQQLDNEPDKAGSKTDIC